MNYVAADFSPVEITNGIWAREMLVPTIAVCLLVAGLFCGLFYRQLAGRRISVERGRGPALLKTGETIGGYYFHHSASVDDPGHSRDQTAP